MKKVNILHICSSMNAGGVETLIYNYYSHMDKSIFHFDVAVYAFYNGIYREKFEEIGANIYKLVSKRKIIASFLCLRKVLKNGDYDIVHIHLSHHSLLPLFTAFLCGQKKRITHFHLANYHKNFLIELNNKIISFFSSKVFFCSKEAVNFFKYCRNDEAFILPNAVDYKKFLFCDEFRINYREKYGIEEGCFCVGTVGRITTQKNPFFIIDVFECIYNKRPNSKLIYVGSGELQEKVIEYVNKKNIKQNVIFCGSTLDAFKIYNAFDTFLFPSLFEGLGISLIEAQINGLHAYASTTVPKDADFSGEITFIDLKQTAEFWATVITSEFKIERHFNFNQFNKSVYNIYQQTNMLEEAYKKMIL